MKRNQLVWSLWCLTPFLVYSGNIRISNTQYNDYHHGTDSARIEAWFTVSWENAWHHDRSYDAAWIFFKGYHLHENRSQRHVLVKNMNYRLIENFNGVGSVNPGFWIPADSTGIMLHPSTPFRGNISWRIAVELDLSRIPNLIPGQNLYIDVHAIEMVYIHEGPFYVGTSDKIAIQNAGAFFTYGQEKPYLIQSESAIEINDKINQLYYRNQGETEYRGDASGPIPSLFPKGFRAFYIMKYELSDGQYADFLNSVSEYYTAHRAHIAGRNYHRDGGSIHLQRGRYEATAPDKPAVFLTWDDQLAFADWAGLRPMTELEYEKACRGTLKPDILDYPWGTADRSKVRRYRDWKGLTFDPLMNEKDLSHDNLEWFGASWYWVMDLNKSMWERCITVGNPRGRAFQGSHGDGNLGGYYGNATNADWPNGYNGEGGIGYRGGGNYEDGMVGSPQGPVAERLFAAWGDGPATIAYGFRAVRTKD